MKILIAVIAYNEEKNIKGTLQDLIDNNKFGYDIVVVDNGSYDNTINVARQMNIPYIRHCINSGGSNGTAVSYFLYAYQQGYDVLCQFDGDGQHMASELGKILSPVVSGDADCVVGSRFLEKTGFQSYFFRRIGIKTFSFLLSRMTKLKFTDITSGFRAYGPRVIRFYGHQYQNAIYDNMNQFLLLAYYSYAKIIEVPVVMRARAHGVSEFNWWNGLFFPIKGLVTLWACFLQRKRIPHYASKKD